MQRAAVIARYPQQAEMRLTLAQESCQRPVNLEEVLLRRDIRR